MPQSTRSSVAKHAPELSQAELEVGDVPDAEPDGRGVERRVVEGQREQIALQPWSLQGQVALNWSLTWTKLTLN